MCVHRGVRVHKREGKMEKKKGVCMRGRDRKTIMIVPQKRKGIKRYNERLKRRDGMIKMFSLSLILWLAVWKQTWATSDFYACCTYGPVLDRLIGIMIESREREKEKGREGERERGERERERECVCERGVCVCVRERGVCVYVKRRELQESSGNKFRLAVTYMHVFRLSLCVFVCVLCVCVCVCVCACVCVCV